MNNRPKEPGAEEALSLVPHHLRPGLLAYVSQGIEPGAFLCAVLDNDLEGAALRGDPESIAGLPALMRWLSSYAAAGCWGSAAKRRAWVKAFSPTREAAQ